MNWNQTGMPSALVSRLGQRREIAEAKSVLNDAQNHILQPVDAEQMAQELVQNGERELVGVVKELTTALANAKRDLEDANRRYERLVSDLKRRGVDIDENAQPVQEADDSPVGPANELPPKETESKADGQAEWEEWDRRFRSLLD